MDRSSAPVGNPAGDPRNAMWPNYKPPMDVVFTHGVGSELFDENGKSYLDFLSGIAVTSFGHAHPHLVAALNNQSEKLWHLSNVFRVPEGERLARRLVEHCCTDKVFFANSGTEAVEAGIKAMRGYHNARNNPERFRVIGFSESFHGRTLAALAAAGNSSHMKGFIPTDYGFDQVPWGDIDALRAAVGEHTAGIVMEPVQGEGGIRPASTEFMQAVRALCDEQGILLMFDEVQCGIGRTGKIYAHAHFDVQADVVALAKGLGGGFPMGACLATDEVAEAMVLGTHGSTFGGGPLAMAVGNAVMDLLEDPQLLPEVQRKGESLKQSLNALISRHPKVIESVHGMGLMIGVKCVVTNADLLLKLREKGMIVGKAGNNMIRLLPPINVSDEHLDRAMAILDEALGELEV